MTVIEYIIVHELTHLLEANHTPEFWNRVAVMQPNFEKAKKWLKEFGGELETDFSFPKLTSLTWHSLMNSNISNESETLSLKSSIE